MFKPYTLCWKYFTVSLFVHGVVFDNFRLGTNPIVTDGSLYISFESVKGDDLNFDYTQSFDPQVNKTDNTNGITNVKNAVKIDQVGVVRKDEIIVIDSDDDDEDEVNITEISDDEIHDSINTGTYITDNYIFSIDGYLVEFLGKLV